MLKEITDLVNICDSFERELVEEMINSAADYVRAVVAMETVAANVRGLEGAAFREERTSADKSRSMVHNSFISLVNSVNRLCDKKKLSRVYTGGEERRAYGDFAMEIVRTIFEARN